MCIGVFNFLLDSKRQKEGIGHIALDSNMPDLLFFLDVHLVLVSFKQAPINVISALFPDLDTGC